MKYFLHNSSSQANITSELYDRLSLHCLLLCDTWGEVLLSSPSLPSLPLPLLSLLLSRDSLLLRSEASAVRALDSWARGHCLAAGLPPSPLHKRAALGPARLEGARLLTLGWGQLRALQEETGILGEEELQALLRAARQPR